MAAAVEEDWVARAPGVFCPGWTPVRIPREEAARVTSEDWAIFAIHGNYVRPTREYEFYHGEPCRLRSRASVYHYASAMGHPATSWDPFLFPNPPRSFLMAQPFPHYLPPQTPGCILLDHATEKPSGLGGLGLSESSDRIFGGVRVGRLRRFRRRVSPGEMQVASLDLDDLEEHLWFDPEPRLERPFRTYADTKYCTKGERILDVAQLMRPGW